MVTRKNSVMSTITVQEHLVGEFTRVHLTFGLCTSPTDTFHFTYQPFNATEYARYKITNDLYLAIPQQVQRRE